jgi:hypothetical protein
MPQSAFVQKPNAIPSAESRIGSRWELAGSRLCLALAFFGSAIIVINPPLRGPDKISHFLRIYSYTRGELLPVTEISGRKGIFVERGLYERLYFFKDRGGKFASRQFSRPDPLTRTSCWTAFGCNTHVARV